MLSNIYNLLILVIILGGELSGFPLNFGTARVALPKDPQEGKSKFFDLEYAYQFYLDNDRPAYQWNFRWNVPNSDSHYILIKAPLIQWDVFVGDTKRGHFIDRFRGTLPTVEQVWGNGELQFPRNLGALFQSSQASSSNAPTIRFIYLGFEAGRLRLYSMIGEISTNNIDANLIKLIVDDSYEKFNDSGISPATKSQIDEETFRSAIRIYEFEFYDEAERSLRKDLQKDNEAVNTDIVLWRYKPIDPLEKLYRSFFDEGIELRNPTILDFKLEKRKETISNFEQGNNSSSIKESPNTIAFSFDSVWEEKQDEESNTFDLEDFGRETKLENLLVTAESQLRKGHWSAALATLSSAPALGIPLPSEFYFLQGQAQFQNGDGVKGSQNILRYLKSTSKTGIHYDQCIKLLKDFEQSKGKNFLPQGDQSYFNSVMADAPVHFEDIRSIGHLSERSPVDISVEQEKIDLEKITVKIDGHEFRALKLGVILDNSGSMQSHLVELRRLIAHKFAKAEIIEVGGCSLLEIPYFTTYVSRTEAVRNTMLAIKYLIEEEEADHIYWFSDLQDNQNSEALDQLDRLLRRNSVTLHVTSVGQTRWELERIVEDNGGKLILKN